jgi:arylsulfatase A-like enzyme
LPKKQPNIVLILVDNLGWGELGCYGGGALRGAPTPRIDDLATQGIKFNNFNVESDCVPTRSALMTGRHPIRTGAFQSVPAGLPQGVTRYERMLPELLTEAGYTCSHFGKWHLGDQPGRLPHDRGFAEWYGIPRTMNEAMFTTSPYFAEAGLDTPYIWEGKAGEESTKVKILNEDTRRTIDRECIEKGIQFMKEQHAAQAPFFCYLPITQMHFPSLAHPDHVGKTGHGEMADSLAEMDHNVGLIMDAINDIGIADDTILIFGSDNGPEFREPWRGTAGYWRGSYHTAMEGSLRVPFMMRWPGKIASDFITDEIVHIVDMYNSLLNLAGCKVPDDRPIDGVDQLDFFFGKQEKSNREGFLFYIKNEMRAVKWKHWKMHFIWEPEVYEGPYKLEAPYLFNLIWDPKEQTNVMMKANWVRNIVMRMIHDFKESLKDHPPIPPGALDPYEPKK